MPTRKSTKTTGSSQSRSHSSNDRKNSNGRKKTSNNDGGSTKVQQNSGLEKLIEDALKDIYWAEIQLTKALPKMKKAATSKKLQNAIEDHIFQTEEHVTRLEEVFELLGKKVQTKRCEGMEGLIAEGETVIEETEEGSMTRDAGIIVAAQKVEHYEIAAYGSLVQLAKTMRMEDVADILRETLNEEKETDELLTKLAESTINREAQMETAEDGTIS